MYVVCQLWHVDPVSIRRARMLARQSGSFTTSHEGFTDSAATRQTVASTMRHSQSRSIVECAIPKFAVTSIHPFMMQSTSPAAAAVELVVRRLKRV